MKVLLSPRLQPNKHQYLYFHPQVIKSVVLLFHVSPFYLIIFNPIILCSCPKYRMTILSVAYDMEIYRFQTRRIYMWNYFLTLFSTRPLPSLLISNNTAQSVSVLISQYHLGNILIKYVPLYCSLPSSWSHDNIKIST